MYKQRNKKRITPVNIKPVLMRQFGTFSKHIVCQGSWWHGTFFTLFIAFFSCVAWAVSYYQEDSLAGWAGWLWVPWKLGPAKTASGAPRDACGVLAAACRWRSGLSHLLSPRKLRVSERGWENVQFYTSLPTEACVKHKKTIPSWSSPQSKSVKLCKITIKHSRANELWVGRGGVLFTCVAREHTFNMHESSLIRDDILVTCETNRAGGNELEGKKRFTGRIVEWMQFKTRRTSAGGDW